jgi:lipopolysaccharide export LptBFGC system permease protein LptF
MSARRRRAALSALGALVAALFCAVLASSVDAGGRQVVLTLLTLAWLVVTAACLVNLVRTERPAPPPGDQPAPPAADVGSDEPA